MNKIAVITPCYNAEEFIRDCVNSVSKLLTNDEFSIEHVIVDDGSTDKSWEIIERHPQKNLKKLRLSKNIGNAAARNYALENSDSDLIFCLDADDVIFQNSLLRLSKFLLNKKADWVYGDFLRSNKNLSYIIGDDYYGREFNSVREALVAMYTGGHFFQHNSLVTRKSMITVGGYNSNLRSAVDFELFTRFLLADYFPHYLSGPLYIHRFHQANLSREHLNKGSGLHLKDVRFFFEMHRSKIQAKVGRDLRKSGRREL